MANLIYSSPLLLEFMLRLKYGRFYGLRLKRVIQEIPVGAKVIDLCCGDCAIYFRDLYRKGIDYLGIDINQRMARQVNEKGAKVIVADVRTYEIPPCDVLLCLGSLYQFSDTSARVIQLAQQVANKIVLLEPVKNFASSKNPLISSIAARMTDFGEGPVSFRFEEDYLAKMLSNFGFRTFERVGPELLGVWNRLQTGNGKQQIVMDQCSIANSQ